MANENALKVSVLGDGAWGTAVAMLLSNNGHKVRLGGMFPDYLLEMAGTRVNRKFLPGVRIPPAVEIQADPAALFSGADLVVQAVPAKFLRNAMELFAPFIPARAPIVSLTKGIEEKSNLRPSQIIASVRGPDAAVLALSGPSHAEEVAVGLPTTVVIASQDDETARKVQAAFSSRSFRAYTSMDVVGVEIGGALKNVIAVAAGICDGLKLGDNAKAALLTRGMKEMAALGAALGAQTKTFFGLSGIGDLIVTCTSRHGRNRAVGERIGRGEKLAAILSSMEMVAEGVWTAKTVKSLSGETGVELPISVKVFEILYEDKDPGQALLELMTRSLKEE